jgi:hypothetical protein
MPIMNITRFIPQETVNKSFGTLGFDESYKGPDPCIVRRAVHVLIMHLESVPVKQKDHHLDERRH